MSPTNSPRFYGRIALIVVGALLVVLLIGWGIDSRTHDSKVSRNVQVAGVDVGGQDRTELEASIEQVDEEVQQRAVQVTTPAGNLDTTAGELGLHIDAAATADAAMDAGRDSFILTRPFAWLGSLFTTSSVDPVYAVDESTWDATLADVEAANLVAPTEPVVTMFEGSMAAFPGVDGTGLLTDDLASQLEQSIEDGEDPITIDLTTGPRAPTYSNEDAQAIADRANALVGTSLAVDIDGRSTSLSGESLRSWVIAQPDEAGEHLRFAFDPTLIDADLGKAIGSVGTPPAELTWTVNGDGSVSYTPGSPGTKCCAPDSSARIVEALDGGLTSVALDLTVAQPQHDAAWAESMGITQQVASFTTNHACCESRVHNIQTMADRVRGTVVAPGETFSLNGLVGPRTTAKGYQEAGVIYAGKFEKDVGGGVSQFTTTLFNAAFFGGLDFVEYQAHTIYISRYPYGREATLSYPAPDLKFTNNTPYGIMIWPSYTGTSITVSLYSTPWVHGEQTGQSESPAGNCTKVSTQRTRTWANDGHTEVDYVYATYQPAEGVLC